MGPCYWGWTLVVLSVSSLAFAENVTPLLEQIKAVGPEGVGNRQAAQAWRELVQREAAVLPEILGGLDRADPTAANWLRAAVDAIAGQALARGQRLPQKALEAFALDTRHSGSARRLAYEWLTRADVSAPARLLPGMLNDPGAELRRDAVALALQKTRQLLAKGDKKTAKTQFQELLNAARDRDQVEEIAKALKDLGTFVNITAQFGFLTDWMLIGPYDNVGGGGFAQVFDPEQKIELTTPVKGKNGSPLQWRAYHTPDVYGMIDLNKAVGKYMGATAYAYTAVNSPEKRPIEIRASSNNAVKIFLNGKLIFFRDEYHHGTRMDQHVALGLINQGRNEILVKICQNEQKDDWAQSWGFQLRVCDNLGGAAAVTLLTPKSNTISVLERTRP
jgi:hypothetical protein